MMRSGSAATTASRSGSRWLPRSTIDSSSRYAMVEGISWRGAAASATPHAWRVSKRRLSVATTEVGGEGTSWVPLLSSTVTVPADAPPSEAEPPASEAPPDAPPVAQADRARPTIPVPAPRRAVRRVTGAVREEREIRAGRRADIRSLSVRRAGARGTALGEALGGADRYLRDGSLSQSGKVCLTLEGRGGGGQFRGGAGSSRADGGTRMDGTPDSGARRACSGHWWSLSVLSTGHP